MIDPLFTVVVWNLLKQYIIKPSGLLSSNFSLQTNCFKNLGRTHSTEHFIVLLFEECSCNNVLTNPIVDLIVTACMRSK